MSELSEGIHHEFAQIERDVELLHQVPDESYKMHQTFTNGGKKPY